MHQNIFLNPTSAFHAVASTQNVVVPFYLKNRSTDNFFALFRIVHYKNCSCRAEILHHKYFITLLPYNECIRKIVFSFCDSRFTSFAFYLFTRSRMMLKMFRRQSLKCCKPGSSKQIVKSFCRVYKLREVLQKLSSTKTSRKIKVFRSLFTNNCPFRREGNNNLFD